MKRMGAWLAAAALALAATAALADTPYLRLSFAGRTETLTEAQFAALPHESVRAFDAHEKTAHVYSGVPVRALLAPLGVPFGEKLRGRSLRLVVLVRARDGYAVAYALAEFDPAFSDRTILLVDRQDGLPLYPGQGPLRIVAPGDKRPARWIRMVTSLDVVGAGG